MRCMICRQPSPARLAALALALPAAVGNALAQQQVVITGSTVERAVEEAPYAITVVDRDTLRTAGPMVNASEALQRVPGLVANNRGNYAQDLQISARGFGARASFGVRGLRLYADGIPAAGPDGQGQVSHFDLAGAERIEVLRGPFSVLYGNSSGGVIALVGAPVRQPGWEVGLDAGSFGLRQARVSGAAVLGQGLDLRASASQMTIDGFRPQSGARKTQAGARLGWQGTRDQVVVLLNHLDQPADDPLGLTRDQFALGPEQTAPQAIDFDTRKQLSQTQLGVAWTHRFDDSALRELKLAAYTGERGVTQWLAIPAGAQGNPRHGGGLIDFDRRYGGVDLRSRWAVGSADVVLGIAADRQRDDRRGYENFTGTAPDQVFGVTGALRRDETNTASTRDVYAQAEWPLAAHWTLSGGLRHGRVALESRDAYLANGDDSGDLDFRYTSPVLGLRWQAMPGLNVHLSVGRGFESPTLNELAYRADGTGGFNDALKAQTSRQVELGAKWRAPGVALDAALFEARTDDELGVATNAGGRSSFQNVGRTLRRGVELGLGLQPTPAWNARVAASWLDATYRDDFLTCAGIPCAAPSVTVPAGNRIAGTPRESLFAELAWQGGAWGEPAVEWRATGTVAVNDRNTDFAPGYGTLALRWSKAYALGAGLRAEWLLRVDNLGDRHYAGSVIVNDANGRYFEPGAPRSVLLALRLSGAL
ncbi:TonB-dependent receptor [Rubrivivax albus]|uniref:TonB-dependent receptor n=2 Tax=Rubrivivax albus TaxID=2499835 RepID=A0A3S2U0P2_9BURK|nr:TonB-dependent receptor [Rubrivivax albus]